MINTREFSLITDAQPSYEEQRRRRVRKYVILMSFRIPALIGASTVYATTDLAWLAAAVLAASVPLPWMAVLIANDRPPIETLRPRFWRRTAANQGPQSSSGEEISIEPDILTAMPKTVELIRSDYRDIR